MSIDESMENIHTGEEPTGDCLRCRFKKGVANRAYHGLMIPGGAGKCTRPGGLCEVKTGEGARSKESEEESQKPDMVGVEAAELADGETVHLVPMSTIRPAPWNPPGRMDPEKVKDLADNFLQVGQQEPALIRPVDAEAPIKYEIVFGHRRAGAWNVLSARSPLPSVIPPGGVPLLKTYIRSMSEADAMILSGVENLQRQGFSDIEEAEFFRACGERYGQAAVKILAEKLSVSQRYVRKRIEILVLPECALKLWREGTWHVGHMEQLLRIGSPEEVETWLQEAQSREWEWKQILEGHVFQLRDRIDRMAIPLSHARFDKEGCKVCRKNTSVQLSLFGGEKNKTSCLDQKCFIGKQQAWLDLHWADGSCKANKEPTRMAVVGGYETPCTGKFGWQDRGGQVQPGENCGDCPKYGSILNYKCEPFHERVCFGDKACFDSLKTKRGAQGGGATSGGAPDKDGQSGPRVEWHGEHFRQEFYTKEVPGLCAGLLTEDPRRLHLALAAFCYRHRSHLAEWLFERTLAGTPEEMDRGYERGHTMGQFLHGVKKLRPLEVEQLMAEAVIMVAFHRHGNYSDEFQDDDRAEIARFLGVDFGKWEPTDEWFAKKTKGELLRYIVYESGLMEEEAFRSYAGKRRGFDGYEDNKGIISAEKLATEKKACLIDLIRNCGVDLAGRLPDEIGNKPGLCRECAEDSNAAS